MFAWNRVELHPSIQRRMARLLGLFVAGVLYFVVVYHLTNLYYARQEAFERFILFDGGVYPLTFWAGYVLLGSALPMLLLFHPRFGGARSTLAASALVVFGAFAQLYVFIIGGQAFPLELFPGYAVTSSFLDGAIEHYRPSLPELLLGLGGIGVAFVATTVGVRILHFMPEDDFSQLGAATNLAD